MITRASMVPTPTDPSGRKIRRIKEPEVRTFPMDAAYAPEFATRTTVNNSMHPITFLNEEEQDRHTCHIIYDEHGGKSRLIDSNGHRVEGKDLMYVVMPDDRVIVGRKVLAPNAPPIPNMGMVPHGMGMMPHGMHQPAKHHSSLAAGRSVKYAGHMDVVRGRITKLNLMSGHYKVPFIFSPLVHEKLSDVIEPTVRPDCQEYFEYLKALRTSKAEKELLSTPPKRRLRRISS